MPGREFRATNASASNLVEFVYGVHPRQITGAPDWFRADKFNIVGTPDREGLPSREQWLTVVKKLLADRWQLKFHREQKELPVYAIQIGKGGPKLTKSAGDPNAAGSFLFKGGTLTARNGSAVLDRPVIDQTGLDGKWDFVLTWTREGNQMANLGLEPRPAVSDPNPYGPLDLVSAMQDELGLKLLSTKATVDVIAVDQVEKPSGN